MEIKEGAKHLHFLEGRGSTTPRGRDTRPDVLCLPEHHKSAKTALWVDGRGDSPSSALLQITSRCSLKMPKYVLSLLAMNLKAVRGESSPSWEEQSRRQKGNNFKSKLPL